MVKSVSSRHIHTFIEWILREVFRWSSTISWIVPWNVDDHEPSLLQDFACLCMDQPLFSHDSARTVARDCALAGQQARISSSIVSGTLFSHIIRNS